MGAKALSNCHPKKFYGSKGARRCRVCGKLCCCNDVDVNDVVLAKDLLLFVKCNVFS